MSQHRPKPKATRRITTRGSQKLLLALFGLLLTIAGLALLELTLACFGVAEQARFDDPFVGFAPGVPVFVEQTDEAGHKRWETNRAKLDFFEPQHFAADKAANAFRIFAVGGSTTAGRPYDHRMAFPAWLARYLRAQDPSRTWEVINAGAISYTSYRVALVMQELARHQPDLFVIYTGHNEFLEERSYSAILHRPEWLKQWSFWLARFRIAAVVRSTLDHLHAPEQSELPSEVETRLEAWTGLERYHRDEALTAEIIEHFALNLRRMIAIARAAGAEVVLVAPIANLADFSPFKSEHRAGLGAADRARFDRLYQRGRALLEAGDPAAALGPLHAARAIDARFADLQFRLGRAYLTLGQVDRARDALVRAKDLDIAPLRALEAIVAQVHTVAARDHVDLIDLPAILGTRSRQRLGYDILGNTYLLDHVHPDIPVHSLIAKELVARMARQGWVRPAPKGTEAAREAIYQRQVASLTREDYARRDFELARVLGWAGKLQQAEAPLLRAAEVFPDDPEIRLSLGVLYEKTGRVQAAAQALKRAAAAEPERPELWFNLGVVAGQQGDLDAGIEALRHAVALAPTYAEAQHNLGVLLRRRGDLAAAAAALEQARALDPAIAAVDRNLGLTYAAQGRLEAAARAFERALALEPDDPEARFNLALAHAQQGQTDAAIAAYRQLLDTHPSHARAGNNLAILLAGRGRLDEAATLLEAALGASPAFADAQFNLGLVREQRGDHAGADTAFERALELDPSNARYQHAIGMLLLGRGADTAAGEYLERARDLAAQTKEPR